MNRVPAWIAALLAVAWIPAAAASTLDLDQSDQGAADFVLKGWAEAQGAASLGSPVWGYEARGATLTGGKDTGITFHRIVTSAAHVREEVTSPPPGGLLVRAYDGRIGWSIHSLWGMGPLSKEQVGELVASSLICPFPAVARSYSGHTLLPSEEIAGRACYVLGMTGRDQVQEKWYFDKETMQLVRTERPLPGTDFTLQKRYSDFRKVGGLVLPFENRTAIGSWAATTRFTSLAVNPTVDETVFVPTMEQLGEISATSATLARQAATSGATATQAPFTTRVVRSTSESSLSGIRSQVTLWIKAPNRVRCEVQTQGLGRTLEVFDGQSGWMDSDVQGFHELKQAEINELMKQANATFVFPLAPQFPLRRMIGERIVGGRRTVALALANFNGPVGTFYFDKETGRLVRMTPPGASDPWDTVVDLSDFRPVGATEIPFATTVSRSTGQEVSRIVSIQNDVVIPDEFFARPPADH